MTNKHRTTQEHVQAVREGKDYYSPRLAINETIDHLVDCALIVKNQDAPLTAETRALDAIGVQVARELKNRASMIDALTDRLTATEGELEAARKELDALRSKDVAARLSDAINEKPKGRVLPELEHASFAG